MSEQLKLITLTVALISWPDARYILYKNSFVIVLNMPLMWLSYTGHAEPVLKQYSNNL